MISVIAVIQFLRGFAEMLNFIGGLGKVKVEDLRACVPTKSAINTLIEATMELDMEVRNNPVFRDVPNPNPFIETYVLYIKDLVRVADVLAGYLRCAYPDKCENEMEQIYGCLSTLTSLKSYLGVFE